MKGTVYIGRNKEGWVPATLFENGWMGNPTLGNCHLCGGRHQPGNLEMEDLKCYARYLQRRFRSEPLFRKAAIGIARGGDRPSGPEEEIEHAEVLRQLALRYKDFREKGPVLRYGDMLRKHQESQCGDSWIGSELGKGWKQSYLNSLFLITANAVVRDGALVMGKGIAGQVRGKHPGIETKFGQIVEERKGKDGFYGIIVSSEWPKKSLGLFQTKVDYRNPSTTDLISRSCKALQEWIDEFGREVEVHLNFPGVGAGGLQKETVWGIVSTLPSNVRIWQYNEGHGGSPSREQKDRQASGKTRKAQVQP